MAAAEEILMAREVHTHDRRSAYQNDGHRQKWRGGLGYICYNKQCQAGVRTVSHSFSIFLSAMLEETFMDI